MGDTGGMTGNFIATSTRRRLDGPSVEAAGRADRRRGRRSRRAPGRRRHSPTVAVVLPEPIIVPSADGVRIAAYDLGGDAGGRPLLLAHATGFHAGTFLPMAQHL